MTAPPRAPAAPMSEELLNEIAADIGDSTIDETYFRVACSALLAEVRRLRAQPAGVVVPVPRQIKAYAYHLTMTFDSESQVCEAKDNLTRAMRERKK